MNSDFFHNNFMRVQINFVPPLLLTVDIIVINIFYKYNFLFCSHREFYFMIRQKGILQIFGNQC